MSSPTPPRRQPRQFRVLQISDDPSLATSRLLLLQLEGYAAEHRFSRQMTGISDLKSFDIFLICDSVAADRACAFIVRIRREAPQSRILRLRTAQESCEARADVNLLAPAMPFELLRGLRLLTGTMALGPSRHS